MRTAKDIIEEYQAKGYGMESLRVLADSRDEPLRTEMLSLLAETEAEAEAGGEDLVYFVVANNGENDEETGERIDFAAVTAENAQIEEVAVEEASVPVMEHPAEGADAVEAAEEESVAEITIGDDDGAAFVHFDAEGKETTVTDYLPATETEPQDLPGRSEGEETEAKQIADETVAIDADNDSGGGLSQDASMDALPALIPATADSPKTTESARQKKRRLRAERRRARKEMKNKRKENTFSGGGLDSFPEIVLSPSEGTETLAQEPCRELQLSVVPDDVDLSSLSRDYAMITASGNMDLTVSDLQAHAAELAAQQLDEREGADADIGDIMAMGDLLDEEAVPSFNDLGYGNVLRLFDQKDEADGTDEEPEAAFSGRLLLLTAQSEDAIGEEAEADKSGTEALSPMAKIGLVRALTGGDPEVYDEPSEVTRLDAADGEHVIVEPAAEESATIDAAALAEIEKEYQERLDEFSGRLLDIQAIAAESENKLRLAVEELREKDKTLLESGERIAAGEKTIHDMTAELAELSDVVSRKDSQLDRFNGIQEEHARLYREFEDLRKAYNEVVTDVMPSLQNERDELVITVERQSEDEETLRSALKVSGRRMAVGYSLAAAAAVMMVALPFVHWMRTDESGQSTALGHQQTSELRDRLDKAERRNVQAEKTIFDLERESKLVKMELAKAEKDKQELAALSDKRTRELASLKSSLATGGASAKTVIAAGEQMSLSGPSGSGKLRVNEVRDPGGSINQVLAENRERYAREDAVMASGKSKQGSIQVSAVSSTRQDDKPSTDRRAASPARGKVGVVKAGEGVAQVVYRELGTRDPEVIAWVIRENKLKKDKRGNPRIYPEQKLLLPSDGSMVKSASAAGR